MAKKGGRGHYWSHYSLPYALSLYLTLSIALSLALLLLTILIGTSVTSRREVQTTLQLCVCLLTALGIVMELARAINDRQGTR